MNFAELSRDFNPLHTNAEYARRLVFGKQVVHGIHILLWALDEFSKSLNSEKFHLEKLSCRFLKPLGINEKVKLSIQELEEKSELKIDINEFFKGTLLTTIILSYSNLDSEVNDTNNFSEFETDKKNIPDELKFGSDFTYLKRHPLYLGNLDLLSDFQSLTNKIPVWQVIFLLNSTRMVGMYCPGLNSIFSAIKVNFDKEAKLSKIITYKVKKYFPKLSRVDLQMDWENTHAELITFVRPEVSQMKTLSEIKNLLANKKSENVKAVVIGGSRGLGEATTKLLALSGAEVLFTYYKGADLAQKIESEIKNSGGNCFALELDINNPEVNIERIKEFRPTHLFYFATPQIFAGTKTEFKMEIFEKFCNYYVHSFLNIFNHLRQSLKFVFYPSSIAIEEMVTDMKEYVLAKSAGEKLCDYLNVLHPEIKTYSPRLPRTQTDQTSSLIKVKSEDPIELMLKYLNEFIF